MERATQIRPQRAYVMINNAPAGAHYAIDNFEPELPGELWWAGVAKDALKQSEEQVQAIIRSARLMLNTSQGSDGGPVAPVLHMAGNYFVSPQIRRLFDDVEPGVHRYFEAQVASRIPIGGKTNPDHASGVRTSTLAVAQNVEIA